MRGRAWIGDAAAVLLVVPLAAVVLAPGWFVGHDDLHPIRLFEQDVMIRAGNFPVRWYPDVAGGLGSPHPQFYAPLFYLLSQLFLFTGLSLTSALKAAIAAVLFGTSLAMHRLAREFFGIEGGVVAAAAVTYAPYHLLDLFVRTAFSEMTVFLFLPLALLTFYRLRSGGTPGRIAAAAASLAGLCLAHTVSLLIVPPILAAYVLLLAAREGRRRASLLPSALAILLGAATSAFFLLPLLAESGAVETESYTSGYFDFHRHFVTLTQLIWSPWGFGLSGEGTEDRMSFRLGILACLGALAALFLRRRILRRHPEAAPLLLFAAAMSLAGIFMSLRISAPLWDLIPQLRFVQFPWRFLVLPAVGMAFLCGAAASALPADAKEPRGRFLRWAAPAVCLLFVAGSVPIMGFERRLPLEKIRYRKDAVTSAAGYPHFTRAFIRDQLLYWADHLPLGAPLSPDRALLDRPKAEVVSGEAKIDLVEEGPIRFRLEVSAAQESLVRLNVYRFAGWTWRLDGRPVPPGPVVPDLPVLTVKIPEGEHVAEAELVRTPARWAGDVTSLGAVALWIGLVAAEVRRRRAASARG